MKLRLIRLNYTNTHTHGSLYGWIGDKWQYLAHTLEDVTRDRNKDGDLLDEGEKKIYGQTAIPFGTYKIELKNSPKRGRIVPWLLGVPHFKNIQIHSGNTHEDTNGCILVGYAYDGHRIYDSRKAENYITELLSKSEKNQIEIL